jgi:hypothetical protein
MSFSRILARALALVLFALALVVSLIGTWALVGFALGKTMHGDALIGMLVVPGFLLARWGLEAWRGPRSSRRRDVV